MSTQALTLWNQLAEAMYLKDSPTAEVSLSELASFSFGRFRSSEGLPEIARPLVGERGHIIALQLKAIPYMEQFLGRKKVSSGYYQAGAVSVIDLQEEPSVLLPNPFDALVIHVTQAALNEAAYAHRASPVEQLVWPHGKPDHVLHPFVRTLLASLEQPHRTSKIFLDHMLHALHSHFVCSYAGIKVSDRQFRGGLSPWQMRRATELLEAHLHGNIALQKVAEACELSVSHFARAFKQTFRRPPYQWLMERRVERARDLIMNSRLPLADIAARCGFGDQSALNRTFKRIYGLTPGIWRRGAARGGIGTARSSKEDPNPYQTSRT
jgi:AraC family transcriptional regulator